MSRIELREINKSYGETPVLIDVSMLIKEGEMISLVGPSGSGKTTTLRVIAGLTDIDNGEVLIDDNVTRDLSQSERGAVIVYQDYALFPHMTVFENIAFGLKVRKISRSLQKKKVNELIKLLHMDGYENRYPNELSGGQKQRVAIARALAIEPKVLLLDEPFSSLDRYLRHSMRNLIKEVQRRLGITTILVTHDIEEALMVSDRIAVLLNGELAQFDNPKNIYEHPVNKAIADFVGNSNIHQEVMDDGMVSTPFGKIAIESDYRGQVHVLYQHDALSISRDKIEGLRGTIIDSTYTGKSIIYTIKTETGSFDVTADVASQYDRGEEVYLKLNGHGLSIFRYDTGGLL